MTQDFNVRFGDIWRIGPHKLLCGDSTEKVMVDLFLKDHKPKLCVTDPPYGINYKSKSSNDDLYRLKLKNDHIVNWSKAFKLSKADVLYVWFSYKHFDVVSRSISDASYDAKQMIVWIKNHFSLQHHFYHLQHEQCFVCVHENAKLTELWTGDRRQTSVWKIASIKPKDRIHPTEKPTGVYKIPILNHTIEGDYVIDMFAGSGAIFQACIETNRKGLGIELDPLQCDRILKRMTNFGCQINLETNLFKAPPKRLSS